MKKKKLTIGIIIILIIIVVFLVYNQYRRMMVRYVCGYALGLPSMDSSSPEYKYRERLYNDCVNKGYTNNSSSTWVNMIARKGYPPVPNSSEK
jgi:hypothetical protein